MMTKLILRFFDCFSWLCRWLRVDYAQFRSIMEVKLTLDGRRPMSAMQHRRAKASTNAFAWTLFWYAFMGGFLGMIVVQAASPLVAMTIVHGFNMTMITLSLVADFTSVLLDTTDTGVLGPRPITSRTMLVARLAHIATYLALLALSLSAATLIAGSVAYHPLFPLVFSGSLVCSICLIVFGTQLFYFIAMRFTEAERFRDIILYVQIAMTIAVVGGYQLMPRLMDMTMLKTLTIDDRWWIYVFPPAWLAAPVDLLTGHVGPPQLILTALGLVVPVGCLVVVVRVLAPSFSRTLARLETSRGGEDTTPETSGPRPPVGARLARRLCRRTTERAAFELVWQMTARDRQFKQRTYPTVAFVVIMAVVWLFASGKGITETLQELQHSKRYLFLLYFACMMVPTAVVQLKYSDHHEAAWVFLATPLARPGEVLIGALKVILVRFVVPAVGLLTLPVLWIWGFAVVPDIVFAGCATIVACGLQALLFGRSFPFSEPFNIASNTGHVGRSLLLLLIPGALGGLHYLLKTMCPSLILPGAPVLLVPGLLLLRLYARTSWAKLEHSAA